MEREDLGYRAYMIRLWHVDETGDAAWRVSVEDVHTGRRQGFADLPSFFAFLEEDVTTVDEELS